MRNGYQPKVENGFMGSDYQTSPLPPPPPTSGSYAVKTEWPRKGHWTMPYGWIPYRKTIYKCSACGEEADNNTTYCPHCGAYMKEASECLEENNAK